MSEPIALTFDEAATSQPDPQALAFEWGRGLFIGGVSDPYTMDDAEVIFGTAPPDPDPDPDPEPEPEPEPVIDPFAGLPGGSSPPRFSDPVPFLTSAPWGLGLAVQNLPIIYGAEAVTVQAVPYVSPSVWVVAGHPCATVTDVFIDGDPVAGWRHFNGLDLAQRPVSFIELTEGASSGALIETSVIGRLSPVSGNAISAPVEIVSDLLRNICGYPLSAARLSRYQQESADAGFALAGALVQDQTIRSALDTILGSAGAAWSGASRTFATRWPAQPGPEPVMELNRGTMGNVQSVTNGDPVTRLLVQYDAGISGEARHALTLRAPIAEHRHGRVERNLWLPWTRSERQAEAIGQAWLQHHARPVWRVSAQVEARLSAGDWVTVSHPLVPVSGDMPVVAADAEPFNRTQTVTLESPAGAAPLIERI